MSSPTSAAVSTVAPFQVYSVHFDFAGGQAIRLRDPATNQFIGASPEWLAAGRDELAAYVRATRPEIQVVFRGLPAADGTYTVGADGTPVQVEERQVTLAFNVGTGLSSPVVFRASNSLPDQIGIHSTKLDWYIREQPGPAYCPPVGTSTHCIATSWRGFATGPAAEVGQPNWVYRPLMEWTCQWAAGQDNEKAICDAIIRNLPASGLRYGIPAYDIRQMLELGGGMCGGWYQMFQQMARCQGVFVHRRRFVVHWRVLPKNEIFWCAIVIRSGGLNQPQPTVSPSEFHDNDSVFPITTSAPLETRVERRYRFWGEPIIDPPDWYGDGHCINFLEYQRRLYLYDACFGGGPFEIDSPLPPDDYSIFGGMQLSSFKAQYLNAAIDYMLGSVYNGDDFHQTVPPSPGIPATNGMTLKTACIPDVVHGNSGVTFYWGG